MPSSVCTSDAAIHAASLENFFVYCIVIYKPIIICCLTEVMDRIEYHWQAMAFDNCSVYFGIIIPSKIRDYIVEYIFLHLPSECKRVHCSCYHSGVIDILLQR